MKFSCGTPELLQALHLVSRAIGGQQALPILGNILMDVKGETCTVSATDLELSIITSFPAKVESEGTITVPAKAILNFAQYNPDAEVVLETSEGTKMRCVSKHAKTMIAGEAATEYPAIAPIEKQTSFALESTSLLHALHLVTFASAKTSLRPVLSGVYLRGGPDKLIFVATDSYRLSEYMIPAAGIGADLSCIIPVKILEEVKVILSGQKPDKKGKDKEGAAATDAFSVQVTLSKQQVEMQVGNTRLLSRLIDGKFPNYEQIVPKDSSLSITFDTRDLSTAVKRMHYFAKEMNNTLTFKSKESQTTIATPQTQIGQDEAVLQTEMKGGEGKIALSSSYLLDFLNHIDADKVEMKMSDSTHPAIFVLPEEKEYMHLIMPLRMQE
jgi:DNA polymerase-3 subunit beta